MSARLSFREVLGSRVLVADGAMGTMLQTYDLSMDDFEGHEGCNEVLNITRPDVVREIHEAYLQAGVDCVETNTFGANFGNLGEYGIAERTYELAEAGARLAREAADAYTTADHVRYVLGSVGPGTKLPTLGHAPYAVLRDHYEQCARGLIDGGVDAIVIETCQDLLQAKAAIVGARRARKAAGTDTPIIVQVTIETTGTMLVGSEIGAALTSLEPLGVDMIGLNCATGPAEMSEHLRYLSHHSRIPLSCMPNAGLPELGAAGPSTRCNRRARRRPRHVHPRVRPGPGGRLLRYHAGTPRLSGGARAGRGYQAQTPPRTRADSIYQTSLPPGHVATSPSGNGPTPTAQGVPRSHARENARTTVRRSPGPQIRDGAHMLDLCVDYVGRDGVRDMPHGFPAGHRRPRCPARAGLHRTNGSGSRAGDARGPTCSTRSTTRTATDPVTVRQDRAARGGARGGRRAR